MRSALFLLLLCSLSSPLAAQDFKTQGLEVLEKGDYDRALVLLDCFKQQDPKDPEAFLYSGLALKRAGRLKDAEIEFNESINLQPREPRVVLPLARAVDEMGYPQVASSLLAGLHSAGQLDQEDLRLLADLLFRQQKLDEALKVLKEHSPRTPEEKNRRLLLEGEIEMRMGNLEEALVAFETVAQDQPGNAQAFFGLAQTSYRGNNPEAAERMAREALDREPDNASFYHVLGMACLRLEKTEEAIRYLERAVQLEPETARFYFDLGDAYRRAGEREKAREALVRYQTLHREEENRRNRAQRVLQLNNQAQQELQSGAIAQAVATFQRVLEADPDDWTAHNFLAKIYLSSGRGALGLTHAQKLLELDAESSEAHYLMAFYWSQRRDYQRARTFAERSKDLRPGDPNLRNLLGNIYFALKEQEKALEEYAAAMRLAPDLSEFRMNYEALAARLGR